MGHARAFANGDGSTPEPAPGADDLRAVIAAQAKVIDDLQRMVEDLHHRVGQVESGRDAATAGAVADATSLVAAPSGVRMRPPAATTDRAPGPTLGETGDGSSSTSIGPTSATSRRHLLTKGAAAATAVIGTAVVGAATASPAAAASGTFDGNPAVRAIANPSTGRAIEATSGGGEVTVYAENAATDGNPVTIHGSNRAPEGVAVRGFNDGLTGPARAFYGITVSTQGMAIEGYANTASGSSFGVVGRVDSPAGTGVEGRAHAASGTAAGVRGYTNASSGTGVDGTAHASTGDAVGVKGTSQATTGIGVDGRASATTGLTVGVRGTASSASGAGVVGSAEHTSGLVQGVLGRTQSQWGVGVIGVNSATTGVARALGGETKSTEGIAMYAVASAPTGATTAVSTLTASRDGIGVDVDAANGSTGVRITTNGRHVVFAGEAPAPPSTTIAHAKGELVFDANADLWLCVATGTPGTWRKVAGPATAGAFTILPSTIRIYDSRAGLAPLNVPKGQLGNQQIRTLDAKIGGAVPAGATAALVNITIVNTGEPGYLALYKNGIAYPGNSTINWNQPATLLANSAVVALDDQARFAVKANIGFCDFVIDTIGYYR